MEIVKFIYQNQEVDFLPSGNENVMVNATQMAKIFGKEVTFFLRNDDTKRFINSCLKTENSQYLSVSDHDDLVRGKQKSGTWMHRILALKFAAWLDPDFEFWVYATIDKIILGHFKAVKEATETKFRAQIRLENKKAELLEKYPELKDFFNEQDKGSEAEKDRARAIRESLKQMKIDFYANQPDLN